MTSRPFAFATVALMLASSAFGEAYKVNVHLEPAAGTGLSSAFFVSGAALKIELGLFSLGPVAPQAELFGLGSGNANALAAGSLFGAGIGLRWRILNDEKGYLFMPGGPAGNLFGNLWLDAHLALSNGGPRVGFDTAVGVELSLLDGLQLGPFAKLIFLQDTMAIFGLSFSVGGPPKPPPPPVEELDTDHDGIPDSRDKCPTIPEDMDGMDDEDGCPETEVAPQLDSIPTPAPAPKAPDVAPPGETPPESDAPPQQE